MTSAFVRTFAVLASLAVAGSLAVSAAADGLPVVGVSASNGVAGASGIRYRALPAGRGTGIERVARNGRDILRYAHLRGSFVVPVVAYDGSAGGLSHDGRTLALISPRAGFPRTHTTLAILSARTLRLRKLVRLRGDFSFDAISPQGRSLYLIQYTSSRDPTHYRVRAYDVGAGRLLRAAVIDPRDRGETMRGSPLTRATSPDGRWAYTLYDGAGKTPFVHALDLARASARCIDLDALAGRRDLGRLRLRVSASGGILSVQKGTRAIELVDTRTFQVSQPGAPATQPRGNGFPWGILAVALGALVILAGIVSVAIRRRRRLAVA